MRRSSKARALAPRIRRHRHAAWPDWCLSRRRPRATRTADLTVHVRSSLSVALTDAGESGEAKTRVEVDSAAATYEIDTVVETNDGLTRLECSEVDVR